MNSDHQSIFVEKKTKLLQSLFKRIKSVASKRENIRGFFIIVAYSFFFYGRNMMTIIYETTQQADVVATGTVEAALAGTPPPEPPPPPPIPSGTSLRMFVSVLTWCSINFFFTLSGFMLFESNRKSKASEQTYESEKGTYYHFD